MLTPHINDENREAELKRRELEPDRFAGKPLEGEARDKAEKQLARMKKEAK